MAPRQVARCLVIARGNGPVLLQAREEVLHQVTLFVQVAVVFAWLLARGARCNDDLFALIQQGLHDPSLGVVGLVGNDNLPRRVLEQHIGTLQVMTLPGCQVKARGVTQRVHRGVNLSTQSTSAAPDGLFMRTPFFAPALCWCARTMVLSIMAYSLSAS